MVSNTSAENQKALDLPICSSSPNNLKYFRVFIDLGLQTYGSRTCKDKNLLTSYDSISHQIQIIFLLRIVRGENEIRTIVIHLFISPRGAHQWRFRKAKVIRTIHKTTLTSPKKGVWRQKQRVICCFYQLTWSTTWPERKFRRHLCIYSRSWEGSQGSRHS